jgi:hypothetical protein
MELPQPGRISWRMSPRFVSTFVESRRTSSPCSTVRLGLVAPHVEQRPDDAVFTLHLDPFADPEETSR